MHVHVTYLSVITDKSVTRFQW